jgi:hypothetical protein
LARIKFALIGGATSGTDILEQGVTVSDRRSRITARQNWKEWYTRRLEKPMQVDLTFDEYGLLIQSVNNLKMQQAGVSEIAAFERLLTKLFQACQTVPVPPDTRGDETDVTFRHQPWNQNLYRFVEPSDWAAAVARGGAARGGSDIDSGDSPVKPETQA